MDTRRLKPHSKSIPSDGRRRRATRRRFFGAISRRRSRDPIAMGPDVRKSDRSDDLADPRFFQNNWHSGCSRSDCLYRSSWQINLPVSRSLPCHLVRGCSTSGFYIVRNIKYLQPPRSFKDPSRYLDSQRPRDFSAQNCIRRN